MKKLHLIAGTVLLSICMALAGCSKSDNGKSSSSAPNTDKKELSGELTIWRTGDDLQLSRVVDFEKLHPNVKVNILRMDDVAGATLTAISAGQGGPDIAWINVGEFARYNNISGIEDLLKPPYNAGQYKKDFAGEWWDQFISLDGKRLIEFPWNAPPSVSYYRPDLFENNGLESDPVKLGQLFEDPNTFFDYAQKLHAAGITLYGTDKELVDITVRGISFFDRSLNYVRNTEQIAKGLDMAKKSRQLKIGNPEPFNIWMGAGKDALNQSKWAFINLVGSWFTDKCCLPSLAPETKGKWHATRMPFNSYGRDSGSGFMILSQSKNKEAAWEWIKYNTIGDHAREIFTKQGIVTAYKPFWSDAGYQNFTDPWLGDQKSIQFYLSLVEKIPAVLQTPLDKKAGELWDPAINAAIDTGTDSKEALKKLQEDTMKAVKVDRDNLVRIMQTGQ